MLKLIPINSTSHVITSGFREGLWAIWHVYGGLLVEPVELREIYIIVLARTIYTYRRYRDFQVGP